MLAGEHARSGRPVVVLAMTPALELKYYDAGFGPERLDAEPSAPVANDVRSGIRERLKRLFAVPVEPRRGEVGRIYEPGQPDVSVVRRIFEREHAQEVFLARNAYWPGTSDRMIEAVQGEPGLRIEPVFEAKGLRILKIRQSPAPVQP